MSLRRKIFTFGMFFAFAIILSSGALGQDSSGGANPEGNITYVIPDSVSLADLLANWGVCGNASDCIYDFSNDSEVGDIDLAVFLALWNRTIDERYLANSPDINNDGLVDGLDLAELLNQWGECENCSADIYADGMIDSADRGILIAFWKGLDVEIFSPVGTILKQNITLHVNLNVEGDYDCSFAVVNSLEAVVEETSMDCNSTTFLVSESGDYNLNFYVKRDGFLILQKSQDFSVDLEDEVAVVQEEAQSSSSGGGGGCTTDWTCDSWSACTEGTQTRTCSKTVEFCYADLSDKPQESRACEIVELTDNNAQVQDGVVSAITGAVVGAAGGTGRSVGAILIVLVIAAAWIAMVVINKKGYFEETTKKNVKAE